MTRSVLLVGCGNIGSRILQALAKMRPSVVGGPVTIDIVDPHPNTDQLVRERLAQCEFVSDGAGGIAATVSVRSELPHSISHDLAIVATTSPPRAKLIEAILERGTPRRMLLEKFLFQEPDEYERIEVRLARAGVDTYVNTPRNAWPDYLSLKSKLASEGPVDMHFRAVDFGLASNAIHFVELYAFLTDAAVSDIDGSDLRGGLDSKRSGFRELAGVLRGRGRSGGSLTITCDLEKARPQVVGVSNATAQFRIDETNQTLESWSAENEWRYRREPFHVVLMSELSELCEQLVTGMPISLPKFATSSAHHLALIRAFNSVFLEPGAGPSRCPIT